MNSMSRKPERYSLRQFTYWWSNSQFSEELQLAAAVQPANGPGLLQYTFDLEMIDVPSEIVFTHFQLVGDYLTSLVANLARGSGDSYL